MNGRFTLFLDIDGVMVTKHSELSSDGKTLEFDPVCIDNLKLIIKEIKDKYGGINIIVASNWRYDLNDEAIVDLLLIQSEFLDCLSESDIAVLDRIYNKEQGITAHIRGNQLTPEQCLILDDDYLGEELEGYQIRTRSEDGIRGIETLVGLIY